MEKYFKLPKEFTENWLKELRSGEYTQLAGKLVYSEEDGEEDGDIVDFSRACCLGVACVMLGGEDEIIAGGDMPFDLPDDYLKKIKYPSELLENVISSTDYRLNNVLANLNDGYNKITYNSMIIQYPNLNIKKADEQERIKYSFNEIADWIEENVELY